MLLPCPWLWHARDDWNATVLSRDSQGLGMAGRLYLFPRDEGYQLHQLPTRDIRLRFDAMWSSSFVLRAALAYISFSYQIISAGAQSWTPAASCGAGGSYTDPYGSIWSVNCGQDNTGAIYQSGTTTGQGIYGCFKGCAHRPECNGFSFVNSGTQAATTGAGTCYYRTGIGSNYPNSTYYAAANIVQYSPSLPVSRPRC